MVKSITNWIQADNQLLGPLGLQQVGCPKRGLNDAKQQRRVKTMREVEKLYEMLRKIQEPKGYYFNKDRNKGFDLLQGLLINKDR